MIYVQKRLHGVIVKGIISLWTLPGNDDETHSCENAGRQLYYYEKGQQIFFPTTKITPGKLPKITISGSESHPKTNNKLSNNYSWKSEGLSGKKSGELQNFCPRHCYNPQCGYVKDQLHWMELNGQCWIYSRLYQ